MILTTNFVDGNSVILLLFWIWFYFLKQRILIIIKVWIQFS